MNNDNFCITTFYKFLPIPADSLAALQLRILRAGSVREIRGLILIAEEGVNATICGESSELIAFKHILTDLFAELSFKDSVCLKQPFRRLKVEIREEIVAMGKALPTAPATDGKRLSPRQWDELLRSREDLLLLDVRNHYETQIGKFRGALDPQIEKFNQFPGFVKSLNAPKDTTVLIYCTGGIRCEKAALTLEQEGFNNVLQLDGGILKYLQECPHSLFEGECFVFDRRVAVDQELKSSQRYNLCPHCGDPGDLEIVCKRCSKSMRICKDCAESPHKLACSKDCAYHLQRLQLSYSNLQA